MVYLCLWDQVLKALKEEAGSPKVRSCFCSSSSRTSRAQEAKCKHMNMDTQHTHNAKLSHQSVFPVHYIFLSDRPRMTCSCEEEINLIIFIFDHINSWPLTDLFPHILGKQPSQRERERGRQRTSPRVETTRRERRRTAKERRQRGRSPKPRRRRRTTPPQALTMKRQVSSPT